MFYTEHATIDPSDPRRTALCDRCSKVYNLERLAYQYRWAGQQLVNTGFLVCERCMDVPAPFERAIVLPPDPPPAYLARPTKFPLAEDDYRVTESGLIRTDETGTIMRIPEEG